MQSQRVFPMDRTDSRMRSRPAFQIVPPTDRPGSLPPLESDPIYRAGALGQSKDGLRASDHDRVLYGA